MTEKQDFLKEYNSQEVLSFFHLILRLLTMETGKES